jgi:hypothetical protein
MAAEDSVTRVDYNERELRVADELAMQRTPAAPA